MGYTVTERLYRSRDGKKIVLEKDVRALTLIATPGDELKEKPNIEKLDTGQPEQKAVKPSSNKAIQPDEDKGAGTSQRAPTLPNIDDDPAKRAETLDQSEHREDGE